MSARVSEKLRQRLQALVGQSFIFLERTRAGKQQLRDFAWSWRAKAQNGSEYGSVHTMTACVQAHRLKICALRGSETVFDVNVDAS